MILRTGKNNRNVDDGKTNQTLVLVLRRMSDAWGGKLFFTYLLTVIITSVRFFIS